MRLVLLLTVFTFCVLESYEESFEENPVFQDSVLNLTTNEKAPSNHSLLKTFKKYKRLGFLRLSKTDWFNTTTSSLIEDLSELEKSTPGDASTRSFSSPNETMVNTGLISRHVYLKLRFINNHLSIPLCISCVVFNVLNCVVFLDKSMRNITNDYLAGISIIQILYSMFTLCDELLKRILNGGVNSAIYQRQKLYIESFVLVVFRRVVYWLVMIVACERMVAVISPLKRKKFKLVKSPVKCIIILITVTFIFHIFSPLKFEILDSTQNDTISFTITRTSFDQKVIESFSLMSQIMFVYVPLMGILLFNIALCVALYRHSKAMGSLRCNGVTIQSRDRQTTIAVLVSTIIFFFLAIPLVTNAFLMNILPNYNLFSENTYTFMFMHQIGILLNLTSFITDFFTYVFLSSRFRNTLKRKLNIGCISKRYAVQQSHGQVNVNSRSEQITTVCETSYI